jgi:hypothetical protein
MSNHTVQSHSVYPADVVAYSPCPLCRVSSPTLVPDPALSLGMTTLSVQTGASMETSTTSSACACVCVCVCLSVCVRVLRGYYPLQRHRGLGRSLSSLTLTLFPSSSRFAFQPPAVPIPAHHGTPRVREPRPSKKPTAHARKMNVLGRDRIFNSSSSSSLEGHTHDHTRSSVWRGQMPSGECDQRASVSRTCSCLPVLLRVQLAEAEDSTVEDEGAIADRIQVR